MRRSYKFPALVIAALTCLAQLFYACDSGSGSDVTVSTLTRPVSMAIAVLDYNPTDSERITGLSFEESNLWEQCIGDDKRPIAFVANSGNDSVARIDLCVGEIKNTHIGGNPFVVSHITVGSFPCNVTTSADEGDTRVFVANCGEASLSVIESKTGQTLPDKVQLDGTPMKQVSIPDAEVAEGRVLVSMPQLSSLAIVTKGTNEQGQEAWFQTGKISLATDTVPSPLPGGMILSPDGARLYISDMNSKYFMTLDLAHPEYPPTLRNVYGATRDLTVSPDGRYLYLSKLDKRQVAVYDMVEDRYLDTNEEKLSHRNGPPPSDDFVYDIELETFPRKTVFVNVWKDRDDWPLPPDGDYDIEYSENDAEDSESENAEDVENAKGEAAEDAEDSEDADNEASAKLIADEDGDTEAEGDTEEEVKIAKLYAYIIGYDGRIQVVDMHDSMHEFYDTNPETGPDYYYVANDELQIDNSVCIASLDAITYRGVTPDGYWELLYNGTVAGSDTSVSGHFEASNNRLYDDNVNFSSLSELMPRPLESSEDPYAYKGDLLVIRTPAAGTSGGGIGCTQEITDADGSTRLIDLAGAEIELEILEATPEYLVYDPNGIDIDSCYNADVDYYIRSNNNYIVHLTELDSSGRKLGSPTYQGRAINTPFRSGQLISGREIVEAMSFEEEDWESYVCTIEREQEDGTVLEDFIFRQDMVIGEDNEVVTGIRCQSRWKDGDDYPVSFENDLIKFAVCQDETAVGIQQKRLETYKYSFSTESGINEIQQVDFGGDRTVGTLLEDSVYLDIYPDFPRLYVLDSSEEIIYSIDLTNDQVVQLTM